MLRRTATFAVYMCRWQPSCWWVTCIVSLHVLCIAHMLMMDTHTCDFCFASLWGVLCRSLWFMLCIRLRNVLRKLWFVLCILLRSVSHSYDLCELHYVQESDAQTEIVWCVLAFWESQVNHNITTNLHNLKYTADFEVQTRSNASPKLPPGKSLDFCFEVQK
jgi:hypothetical protein